MAILQIEVDDEIAKKVAGFFNSGRDGEVVFVFTGRKVQGVRLVDVLSNHATSVRHFVPTATGVFVVTT